MVSGVLVVAAQPNNPSSLDSSKRAMFRFSETTSDADLSHAIQHFQPQVLFLKSMTNEAALLKHRTELFELEQFCTLAREELVRRKDSSRNSCWMKLVARKARCFRVTVNISAGDRAFGEALLLAMCSDPRNRAALGYADCETIERAPCDDLCWSDLHVCGVWLKPRGTAPPTQVELFVPSAFRRARAEVGMHMSCSGALFDALNLLVTEEPKAALDEEQSTRTEDHEDGEDNDKDEEEANDEESEAIMLRARLCGVLPAFELQFTAPSHASWKVPESFGRYDRYSIYFRGPQQYNDDAWGGETWASKKRYCAGLCVWDARAFLKNEADASAIATNTVWPCLSKEIVRNSAEDDEDILQLQESGPSASHGTAPRPAPDASPLIIAGASAATSAPQEAALMERAGTIDIFVGDATLIEGVEVRAKPLHCKLREPVVRVIPLPMGSSILH